MEECSLYDRYDDNNKLTSTCDALWNIKRNTRSLNERSVAKIE